MYKTIFWLLVYNYHIIVVESPSKLASLFYRLVLMSSFVSEKEHLQHALLILFNQKKVAAVESHRYVVNTLHRLENVRHRFDNLKVMISM